MDYFFILGCHRSGTTLLQQALNRHSQIAIPPETKYFSSFLGHSHACQARRLERINRDLGIRLPPISRRVRSDTMARALFEELAQAYVRRLDKPGIAYFGEKTPAHTGYWPQITKLFPKAKILWLYRDGRDVALSMRGVPWMSQDLAVNFLVWLFYAWKQEQAAARRDLAAHFVKYEDLVMHPEQELSRVSEFLGIRYEPAMAQAYGNQEGVLPWEASWKARAFQPITADRAGVWRQELSEADLTLLESLGGDALERLGYALASQSRQRIRAYLSPRLWVACARFAGSLPFDELTRQLFGRAFCR